VNAGGIVIPAGYAAYIGANGQVQGPFKYDATIFNAGALNFPLFGKNFFGDGRHVEIPDSSKDRIDQIFGIDLRNQPPAPVGTLGGLRNRPGK
jgi:hypothetical protein